MDYRKISVYLSWLVFAITFVVYSLTVAPTVSYWDCGEFIAASYKLAVPHPPGAPLYLLVGRIFSMIPFVSDIGLRVNYISVISSALTVMLLYLIIVHLFREWRGKLESETDWMIAMVSGAVGSLTFAFTHSFWFNAVEAEVYAPSMLFTALIVWLSLVWSEKSEKPGNERYLLIIAYLIGLAIGVHLLNVLALPFLALIIYFRKFDYEFKTFAITSVITVAVILIIYPGIVKYLPQLASVAGVFGLVLFFVAIIWFVLWAVNNNKRLASLMSLSVLLIIIGYSTYSMIYIRSNLDPMIDENNPENLKNFISYLNREQYGEHSIVDRAKVWRESQNKNRYSSATDFFWRYQINKMYVRYFMWQFAGMDENSSGWNGKQFFMIPFMLGLIGVYWHFKNDPRRALAVLALFFMTGLAIILYLNQPDPQPRERDYSYVGSFFAFSIWIGMGTAGLIELIRGKNTWKEPVPKALTLGIAVLLLVASPLQMFSKNYSRHDRSERYIAWDYSYNMLQSCEPNALLFTNGDNDTFPLWYLQEVEGIRTDVRIINLSLLNTGWYIKQLRDLEPKVPISFSDSEIDRMGLVQWKSQTVSLPVPKKFGEMQAEEFRNKYGNYLINPPARISFKVNPTLQVPGASVLRVQDYMILNIIHANRWRKPVYFAVTVAKSNMLGELQNYLRMDGLALKLVPFNNWKISPGRLEENLTKVYKYRDLQNPNVYHDPNIVGLIQNYRTAFLQLADYYLRQNDYDKVKNLLATMEEKVPARVTPWTNRYLRVLKESYEAAVNPARVDSLLASGNPGDLPMLAENLYRMNQLEPSQKIFEALFENNPNDVQALSVLISIFERRQKYERGIEYLDKWIKDHPNDAQAKKKLEQFRKRLKS